MDEIRLQGQYQLPIFFDLLATFLFAFSGSVKAIEKNYDFIGVFVLAMVTSTGGSLIRDILLQNGPPAVLLDYRYILMVLLAGTAGIYFYKLNNKMETTTKVVDAISLGMYAVFGTQKAIALELGVFAAFIIGFINAVGGGLIRDILTREESKLFKPGHFYSVASIVAIVVFLILGAGFKLNAQIAALIAIAASFLLRFSAVKFNWTTKAIRRNM
ncbi:trimeric intracellular cation channel family protein [Solitalea canadensis]|uniref:Putative membrane protein n=1 Tax=Solitalea canadensis (strain ATCC 29591 / DSM 3403 / JCM 21819 / LMG 8368 / NBRC 15130 / NCIMB 12057 / USAM 9D) TaxID=929556 RepID=H8KXT7_SOLCM|nr:TRIC cation channel family protein [Solitalea canadensis]AFD05502.1 putative membrane protein [Solitalea canadensis DSM 3403]